MIREYIKKIERYSILISALMVIMSIFLVTYPLKSLEVFVIIFSIIILINGVGYFVSYFTMSKEDRPFSFDIIMGLLTFISGIMILIYRKDLISVFPIILGIWIIVNNLFKLQLSINLSSIIGTNGLWLVLITTLMIILGITLIINPFESIIAITTLSGLLLLITEVISIIESVYILTKLR